MRRIIGIPLLCVAMFSIVGGHWAVLQSVAWVQMLWDYSRDATIATAVEKTFSGEHPCSLCNKVQEGRQKEDTIPTMVKADKKFEIFVLATSDLLTTQFWNYFSYPNSPEIHYENRNDAPPQPVPRHI